MRTHDLSSAIQSLLLRFIIDAQDERRWSWHLEFPWKRRFVHLNSFKNLARPAAPPTSAGTYLPQTASYPLTSRQSLQYIYKKNAAHTCSQPHQPAVQQKSTLKVLAKNTGSSKVHAAVHAKAYHCCSLNERPQHSIH